MHKAVLLNEAIGYLDVKADHWYLDATFGRGGHSREILNNSGKVLAFDIDKKAVSFAKEKFAKEIKADRFRIIQANFSKLEQEVSNQGVEKIAGILFDFGTSTEQLTDVKKGFSFQGDGELDMRMDKSLAVKAKDLLAALSVKELAKVFAEFGGERQAKRIAEKIVSERKAGRSIVTNKDLRELIVRVKRREKEGRIHSATRVFQALRIAVNDELGSIREALPQALELLKSKGRLVTIAFHEGEDKVIKDFLRDKAKKDKIKLLTKGVVTPKETELSKNPRSRSSKLRAAEKL